MIRILQISDIHWLAIPDAMDEYNIMRREFLDDIKSADLPAVPKAVWC